MFNNDKERAQFEYMQLIMDKIRKIRKHQALNVLILFSIFSSLGYLGTQSIPLSIVIGLLPVIIRGVGDDVIITNIAIECSRCLHDYEGDLEWLNARLNADKTINDVLSRKWYSFKK